MTNIIILRTDNRGNYQTAFARKLARRVGVMLEWVIVGICKDNLVVIFYESQPDRRLALENSRYPVYCCNNGCKGTSHRASVILRVFASSSYGKTVNT